jgi:ectoine hydroxylase-related dioxygenase (phytanoyl-CoA dioxygenase family)
LPNDRAIHKWHYDSDAEHKHPDWEINFQLALTKMFDSNATWIESIPGIKDYKPMELEVGQFSIFDGNKLTHGNKPNVTNKTRVSMDFRVIPYDKYEQFKCKNFCWGESLESVTTSRKFDIGGYYSLYEI